MNKQLISILSFILLSISTTNWASAELKYYSGFQEITIMDSIRPLQVAIWYPTLEQEPIENIGDNIIFIGETAIRNAKIAGNNHPLVLISHGFGGSWINQVWLASALSKQGFIVAAPNHPGTTTQNMDRSVAQNMLERPNDISRVISYLLSNSNFSQYSNANDITVIGHSYGGWTAIEAIGGQFSTEQFKHECLRYPSSFSCSIFNQQMQGLSPDSEYFKLNKNVRDPRIKTAIILDLGLAKGFTPESLTKIAVPILVVSTGEFEKNNSDELESQYLIKHSPSKTTQYMQIDEATHFSFMGLCKPNAIELLQKDARGDEVICQYDINNRQAIHQRLINEIILFLNQ